MITVKMILAITVPPSIAIIAVYLIKSIERIWLAYLDIKLEKERKK